jgi:hypothetical protein
MRRIITRIVPAVALILGVVLVSGAWMYEGAH